MSVSPVIAWCVYVLRGMSPRLTPQKRREVEIQIRRRKLNTQQIAERCGVTPLQVRRVKSSMKGNCK